MARQGQHLRPSILLYGMHNVNTKYTIPQLVESQLQKPFNAPIHSFL